MRRPATGLLLRGLAAGLLALFLAFFVAAPAWVEVDLNGIHPGDRPRPSEPARTLHARLRVADLHADPLLWGRDLTVRGRRGHVDVPRLREGRVAVQVFGVVTQAPARMNVHRNEPGSDRIRLLAFAQLWPPRTWSSLRERALYLAGRLHRAAESSRGHLAVVRTARDLASTLERRGAGDSPVAGILALEGAHALEGDVGAVETLFDAGFRMVSLTHFVDTDLGGSAHGVTRGGLTAKGRELIRRMEARGVILDLAHASPALVTDAVAASRRPVVVSHTGVRGTCDNPRNLSDGQLRAVAGTGGVVGIGYWPTAVCGTDAGAVARAIRHAVETAGIDHVGLGSDFDGAVRTPFDAAGLVELTDALLAHGFDDAEVERIMGANVIRVLRETLP